MPPGVALYCFISLTSTTIPPLATDLKSQKMEIKTHEINHTKIAEIIADGIILKTTEDGLDLLGNLYYQGYYKIIIQEKNITPEFFDLKSRIAGDILQKFAQYRMPLIIVGDFSKFESKSLNDFIYESNTGKHVNFVSSISDALHGI